jgi:hypothetical protein
MMDFSAATVLPVADRQTGSANPPYLCCGTRWRLAIDQRTFEIRHAVT